MFDFQKLNVYQKAKSFNQSVYKIIKQKNMDRVTNDQFRRASFSIMLNIAEGNSRFSNRDRKNFMIISRGSVFECAAILDYLKDTKEITEDDYTVLFENLEEISKMLFSLIRKLEKSE